MRYRLLDVAGLVVYEGRTRAPSQRVVMGDRNGKLRTYGVETIQYMVCEWLTDEDPTLVYREEYRP